MVYPISTRGSTEKESDKTIESEEHRTKKQKKCRKKKVSRVGLNPSCSYRIPPKRREATPSDHSDMAVLFGQSYNRAVIFWQI